MPGKKLLVLLFLSLATACTTIGGDQIGKQQAVYNACTQIYGALSITKQMSRVGQIVVDLPTREAINAMFTTIVDPICIVDGKFNPAETESNLAAIEAALARIEAVRQGGTV